jgi:hypothetical protein
MGEPTKPYPVKLVCPVLSRERDWLESAKALLEGRFGRCDLASETWPFEATDYYEQEMGGRLLRRIFSFERLIEPSAIVDIKHTTNELERIFADQHDEVKRPVNLDPGYVAESKMVLATTKDYNHRIYLRDGIYAEVTLQWHKSEFQPWPWTYTDYRTKEYRDFFAAVRHLYRKQLKGLKE